MLLARELRAALDGAGAADGKRYIATIAAGADEKFLLDSGRGSAWLRELAASLDWINLMSYDYHGSWERVAGLNAPLRRDPADPAGTNVEASVKRLLENGIPARKITLGIPFYGKGWAGCAPGPAGDGLYQPCAGLASGSAAESFDFAFLTDPVSCRAIAMAATPSRVSASCVTGARRRESPTCTTPPMESSSPTTMRHPCGRKSV